MNNAGRRSGSLTTTVAGVAGNKGNQIALFCGSGRECTEGYKHNANISRAVTGRASPPINYQATTGSRIACIRVNNVHRVAAYIPVMWKN